MESTSKQIQVGIFLVAGLLIAMASIFMIGGDKSLLTGRIRLHARFETVQGLADGSVVSLSGIVVGNIEKLEFFPDANAIDVTMIVDKKFGPRITKSAQVEIRTQGALGDKYIYIIPGEAGHPAVKDGDVLEVAKATDLLGIFAERGKETEKVFDIINEIYKITKTVNADGRLERIVSNMATASEHLKGAAADAHSVTSTLGKTDFSKVQSSMSRLDSVLAKIDRGEGTLGALINDPTVHERLKAFLGGSERRQHIKSILRTSIEQSESK